MDLFRNAKTVRLRSHHKKYLIADEDEETVTQERKGMSRSARWRVEIVDSGNANAIRLKSSYGTYLTASNQPWFVGMTGRKVLQTLPRRLDSSIEWEPVKEGSKIRLLTPYGCYLRANSKLPPWRNSVTHDVPHRSSTQDWVVWDVDIVEFRRRSGSGDENNRKQDSPWGDHSQTWHGSASHRVQGSSPGWAPAPVRLRHSASYDTLGLGRFYRTQSCESLASSTPKHEGRLIQCRVAERHADADESGEQGDSFMFKGHSIAELTQRLEEETQLKDIIICTRSPLNGKLYLLRLKLPPNNQDMQIIVVSSTSKLGQEIGGGNWC